MLTWFGIGALAVLLLEILVVIKVAAVIGFPATLLLLIAFSAVGEWIVKREGVSVLRRIREGLREGRVPTTEVVDGALIVVAGALLLPPGFVTGVIGLLLVIPPVRTLVRIGCGALMQSYVSRRLRRAGATIGDDPPPRGRRGPSTGTPAADSDVLDVEGEEVDLFGSRAELGPSLGG